MKISDTVRIAFVGAGNMAREHIKAFADVPGAVLAGIHSRTRSRAEALALEYGIPVVCDSIPELYNSTKADLVVVTVFELAMEPVSRECFEFPWAVLLEKPPGYNVDVAEQIEAAAGEKGRRVFVALNRRFYSSTRAVLSDLAAQEGKRFIKIYDQQDQKQALASGQPPVVVENYMYANSIHVIDYLRLLGRGRVVDVQPVISWKPANPGVVLSRIEFDSGDIGLYEGIWNGPGPWAVTVSTPFKRWEIRPLEKAAFQLYGERQLQVVESHPWDKDFKPGFRLQAEAAVAAVRKRPSVLPTIHDALETLRLIRAIFT